jgi:hypothetical protein
MLLEAGCTTAEVSSITGQTYEMVEHYARQVNQRKLAAALILKWGGTSSEPSSHNGVADLAQRAPHVSAK